MQKAHADDEKEVIDIDDPRVPEAVRQHGRRFRQPARYVVDLGGGEYALSTQGGELLDLVCVKRGD